MSTLTQPTPARRRRRWLVRFTVGVTVIVGLGVALVAYDTWLIQRKWQEALAEADRLDPGWSGDDIAAARSNLPDERNSYRRAIAVAKHRRATGPLGKNKQIDEEFSKTAAQNRYSDRVLEALRERVAADGTTLAEARLLADCPEGRVPPPTSPLIFDTSNPSNFVVFELVKLLLYPQFVLQVEDSDFDAALNTLRAMVNASRPLADAPSLLSNLLAAAIRHFVASGVERLLAQGEPPAIMLSDLQRLLEPEASRSALLPAFRGQRALLENTMRGLDDGRVSWSELSKALPGPRRTGWPTIDAWLHRLLGKEFDRANVTAQVRYYTWSIERLKESRDGLIERADEWSAIREQMPDGAKTMVGSLSRYVFETAVQDAKFRSAITALAAEQFRQANGRWPATLDELVPTYLPATPHDPFTSKPLRLVRHPDGIVIYSFGEDKTDDGGDVRTGQPKGRDEGIRLWDVDKRRQPPKQPPPPD